jgi:hypothetical protein
MCRGKLIRFFCPESNKQISLCPTYDAVGGVIHAYRKIWRKSEFRCCGGHDGECTDCPALHKPGHVEVINAWGVHCNDCGARMRMEIEAVMEAAADSSDNEDPMDETDAGLIIEHIDDEIYMPEHVDEDEYKDDVEVDDFYMPEHEDEDDSTVCDDDICDCAECTKARLKRRSNRGITYDDNGSSSSGTIPGAKSRSG